MKMIYVPEGTDGAKLGISGKWFIKVPDDFKQEESEPVKKRKRRTKAEMKAAEKGINS